MSTTPPLLWCASSSRYDDAARSGNAGPIPLLLPATPEKAARWERVLTEQFGDPVPPAPGVRLVCSWTPDAVGPATVFARRSAARLGTVDSIDEVVTAVTTAPEDFVVVVTTAAKLTVAALAQVSAAARGAGKYCGFLTGRGQAELSFAVAKALLHPRPDHTRVDVFDAPSHRRADNLARLSPTFATDLRAPSLAKVLRSHGEGGHAKFPDMVVCGLLEQTEFPHLPHLGCGREPRRCKRAAAVESEVLFTDEIPAAIVAFVCCNGFNVAAELYPSPVSVALGFSEGWAGAVISPVRPLLAPDSMFEVLLSGLRAGWRFGPLVWHLNDLSARLNQNDAFVLHGDPYSSMVSPQPEAPAPAAAATDDLSDWLARALVQTERGRRVLRATSSWLGAQTPDAVRILAKDNESLEHSILNALKWAQARPAGESLRRLTRMRALIGTGMSTWDRGLTEILLESRDSFDAFDVGHYDQAHLEQRQGENCRRCGTPTEIHLYGAGRDVEDRRAAESCLVCGPVSAGRCRGLRLKIIKSSASGAPHDEFLLRAQVSVPQDGSVSKAIHLRMRFYDKANGGCAIEESRTVPAEDQDVEFRFPIPEGLGLDLHSVRLVAVSGGDLAYARARFVGLPGRADG